MFNIFEQPWTLLGLSVLVLFGVLTVRSVFPEKRRWRQWLLPICCVAIAFSVDMLVTTDSEKINAVLDTALRAVVEQNCGKIEPLIAENYSDSYHKTKAELMNHAEQQLSPALITKAKKRASLIQISSGQAKATLFLILTFDKKSFVAQNYIPIPILQVRTVINLQKQTDSNWLITQIEILEVNSQPISWRKTRLDL